MERPDALSARVAANLRQLREARGATQEQMARLAKLPRATWANLETGSANPTLSVLHAAAVALQVPIDELVAAPRAAVRFTPREKLPSRTRTGVEIRSLLPDPIPGTVLERLELPPRAQMIGVPHTPGTREYLACETGTLELTAGGDRFTLRAGDVLVFRGDQRHAYRNPGTEVAVGYSVVLFVPVTR